MITTSTSKRRVAVRWPFRVLAALLLALFVVTVGMWLWFWHGEHAFGRHEQMLVHLPMFLWFGRLLFFAALRSSVPPGDNAWPFASDRLLVAYFLGLFVFDYVV